MAKKYWHPSFESIPSNSSQQADADDADDGHHPNSLTLIVLHSTSFHKETWEPTLEQLFERLATAVRNEGESGRNGRSVRIREAWAIDCPNHGEAAVRNESLLGMKQNTFSCRKYAQAVHRFLHASPRRGACVDFKKRKLVGVGHSLGGNSMLILQHLEPLLSFTSIIIVEPILSPAGPAPLQPLRERLVKVAKRRKCTWPDRDTARRELQSNHQVQGWDPKVFDLYMEYALKGVNRDGSSAQAVTLTCSREQEIAMYLDKGGLMDPMDDLNKICARTNPSKRRVHLILGEIPDFVPREAHEALLDPRSGRTFASVRTFPKAGHLIPQQLPVELGNGIYECLLLDIGQEAKL